jgi:hypothetical protein
MKTNLPYWLRNRYLLKRTKLFFAKLARVQKDGTRITKRPKKMTHAEETACQIFASVLRNKGSKLYYDIHTQECYLRSEDAAIYVFLEARNVKIINSVFGYDVNISSELEGYLLEKFIREMTIRRKAFKTEALSKVNHSLDLTLDRVQNKFNQNDDNH